mmetsp:Transcript_17501/g.18949  ORF Transcript_17501/g.18949 Transcript_17501/m.18949 type:complete len:321 (+) Transcript_17501:639-1601(+)
MVDDRVCFAILVNAGFHIILQGDHLNVFAHFLSGSRIHDFAACGCHTNVFDACVVVCVKADCSRFVGDCLWDHVEPQTIVSELFGRLFQIGDRLRYGLETVHRTNSTSSNHIDAVVLVTVACRWHRRWQLELFGSVVLAAHGNVEWFPVVGFHHGCLPSFLVEGCIRDSHSECVESIKALVTSNRNSQKGLLRLLLPATVVRRNLFLFADVTIVIVIIIGIIIYFGVIIVQPIHSIDTLCAFGNATQLCPRRSQGRWACFRVDLIANFQQFVSCALLRRLVFLGTISNKCIICTQSILLVQRWKRWWIQVRFERASQRED